MNEKLFTDEKKINAMLTNKAIALKQIEEKNITVNPFGHSAFTYVLKRFIIIGIICLTGCEETQKERRIKILEHENIQLQKELDNLYIEYYILEAGESSVQQRQTSKEADIIFDILAKDSKDGINDSLRLNQNFLQGINPLRQSFKE